MKLSDIQDEAGIERFAIENNINKFTVRELLTELWNDYSFEEEKA